MTTVSAAAGPTRRGLIGYGLYTLTAPAFAQTASAAEIVSCAIHPAIGIARVGDSPTGFFYGPELPGVAPSPDGGFKDSAGRVLRQAQRFRIFGYDAQGRVVREITTRDAEITWRVELANQKSAWYEFHLPLDIPEAEVKVLDENTGHRRRNARIIGPARAALEIRPGARSVTGANRRAAFDTGTFLGQRVPLGEMRTDERGRLTVLGGFGQAHANPGDSAINNYANNDGWCDDTSDGPVDAVVRIGGRTVPVSGAWLIVGPPAFAPGIAPMITLYDTIYAASAGPRSQRPSFSREIFPIFERLAQHQWVNAGFARDFGHGGAHDFMSAQILARLSDARAPAASFRREIFARFRDPSYAREQERAWPPYYGDQDNSPRAHQALLAHQYEALRRWAAGDFDADLPAEGLRFAARESDIPLGELPGALDRAALDAASGAPFHPGIECGWVVRHSAMYEAPFRFRRRQGDERDWGERIHQNITRAADGPNAALSPGGLTRWMGVPWQADSINCGAGYDYSYDPYLPAYWPALAPNDVLTEQQYQRLMQAQGAEAIAAALAHGERRKWVRGYDDGMTEPFRAFQQRWAQMGFIVERPGPPGGPARVWVETERTMPESEKPTHPPAGSGSAR